MSNGKIVLDDSAVEFLQEEVGGGSTVVANPTLVGDEDDLTGLEVDGIKYKVPEGGGGGGRQLLMTPMIYLLDNKTIYDCVFHIASPAVEFPSLSFKFTEMFEYLVTQGLDITETFNTTNDQIKMYICQFSNIDINYHYDVFAYIEIHPQTGSGLGTSLVLANIGVSDLVDNPIEIDTIRHDYTLADVATVLDTNGFALLNYVVLNINNIIGNVVIIEHTNTSTGEKTFQKIVIDDLSAFITACGQIVSGS